MKATFALLISALVLIGPTDTEAQPAAGADVQVPNCQVQWIDEFNIEVAASEPGVIMAVERREGADVEHDDVLAQVDDRTAVAAREVAFADLAVAQEQVASDVNVKFAKASYSVAVEAYNMVRDANAASIGAVPRALVNQRLYEVEVARLRIQQNEVQQKVDQLAVDSNKAKVRAADERIARHKIHAPFAGRVVAVMKHTGEWVNPGDAVFHLVRMDQMKIVANLRLDDVEPIELEGRKVTVSVEMRGGGVESFPGEIVFVPPHIEGGNRYQAWAFIKNRQRNGQWLLQDGRPASMTIHMN